MNVRNEILVAIHANNLPAAKRLIKPVTDQADKKIYGDLLLTATIKNNVEIVELLLKAGAVTNQKTENENTCFHLALIHRNAEMFRHLLNHDLSGLYLTNSDHETPIELAIMLNRWDAVEVFLRVIKIENPDEIEKYRKMLSVRNQNDLIELLFKQDAAKQYIEDSQDFYNDLYTRGYLHKAVESRDEKTIMQLLSSGFNLEMTDSLGRTPEKFAAELDTANNNHEFSTTLARAISEYHRRKNIHFKKSFSMLVLFIQAERQSTSFSKIGIDTFNHILTFLHDEKPSTHLTLRSVKNRLVEISTECKPKTAARHLLTDSYGLFRIHSAVSRQFISKLKKTVESKNCSPEKIQANVNTFLSNNRGRPCNTLTLLQQHGFIASIQQPAITLTADDAREKPSPQTPRASG